MYNTPDPKEVAPQEVDKLVCSAEFPEGCKTNLSPEEEKAEK